MLTGTIPPFHGVHNNSTYQLHEAYVTLAEMLKEEGYATGAVNRLVVGRAFCESNRLFDGDKRFVEKQAIVRHLDGRETELNSL